VLREATKDLARLRQITGIVAKYGWGEWIKKSPDLTKVLDSTETPVKENGVHRESAPRRFRLLLEELGPTFIKLGQVLSARPDLVPPHYIAELKSLQNQCEPLPFEDVRVAIAEGLNADPYEMFAEIEEKPLATASIAQVHIGLTKTGERVVIKVQRPGIREEITSDIVIMYRLARIFEATLEESRMAEPVGVVREFERALLQELDFHIEAANLREFKKLHDPRTDIAIPVVYNDLSSSTVLTMSRLDGVPFTRLPDTIDKKAVAERIVREAFDEVFIDGVFHADPHPGNLMLLDDGRYGILDLGVIGRLSFEMRETLVVLALAIAVRDADTVARTLYRLGQRDERIDIGAVRTDTVAVFERYLNKSIKDVDSTLLLQDLLMLAMKHKIRVPAEYTMLGRAAATIEGLVRELHPDIDVAKVATPYAEKLLFGRVTPDNVQGNMYRALLQFQGMSQDLPIQLSQILSDLSSGNFAVNVQGRTAEKISTTMLVSATLIAGSVIGAAFVVGTFIALSSVHWTVFGVPLVALVGAVSATTVIFWLSVYAAVRPRLKKISLTGLLVRRRPRFKSS
jgi:ubiquinone biosynthesis protein